ncbi:unnamed protein product [Prorocentrum cordatum]|uniref:Uncharacterized protein n=1 Tax=Prorocentrum cordatum TaxID=2364126 RepID=A0ABN9VZJ6_9DINO|nr:unnamed protein product [Polarella glacialis]
MLAERQPSVARGAAPEGQHALEAPEEEEPRATGRAAREAAGAEGIVGAAPQGRALLRGATSPVDGFVYLPAFLGAEEAALLLEAAEAGAGAALGDARPSSGRPVVTHPGVHPMVSRRARRSPLWRADPRRRSPCWRPARGRSRGCRAVASCPAGTRSTRPS